MKLQYGLAAFLMLMASITAGLAGQSALSDQYDGECGQCFAYLEFPPVPPAPRPVSVTIAGAPTIAHLAVAETPCTISCEPCLVECLTAR